MLDDAPLLDLPFWNDVMERGHAVWAPLRARLVSLLSKGSFEECKVSPHLIPMADVQLHMPTGYNGRASTVVVSGTNTRWPNDQIKDPDAKVPDFGPTRKLDIELELGAIIGTTTKMGTPLSVAQADASIFGYVLLNDWSARDIQAWEYQLLGPFQAKAFATSISPLIVTAVALAPFRAAPPCAQG